MPSRDYEAIVIGTGQAGKPLAKAFAQAGHRTAILEAAGQRVHRYTSPHIVRFNERILLSGREIEDGPLVELVASEMEGA